jgi:hypothetical protein
MHLARGLCTVWKVLESKLAAHRVKRACLERESTGITFSPVYGGTLRGR